MHDVKYASFRSAMFEYTFGPHTPRLQFEDRGSVAAECPDSDNGLADGTLLPPSRRSTAAGTPPFEGNPMAGPIALTSARAGADAIAVRIDRISIDRPLGRTLLAPNHGLVSAGQIGTYSVPRRMYQWTIDEAAGVARLANPAGGDEIFVKLNPLVGCIGVCPPRGQRISTLFAGAHGGNMDLPSLGVGTTIYLPTFADGALVMLGDVHAAQGHGEAIGGGIEVCATVSITMRVVRDWPIVSPHLLTATEIGAIATDGDLRTAIQVAYGRLIVWLFGLGMNRFDAYQLLSQVARIEIGNLVTSPFSVAVLCAIDQLPSVARRKLEENA